MGNGLQKHPGDGRGIIFAADLPSIELNRVVLNKIIELIDVIKLPNQLLFREGAAAIQKFVSSYRQPFFFDTKIADVPHTNAQIVRTAKAMGASAVSVHGFVGPDGILACMEEASDELDVVVQLELTSPGAELFNVPLALPMAELANGLGVSCVQAPGNRPSRIAEIRRILGPESTLICCGVGAQGGSYSAVRNAGGSYVIVGRAIYGSKNPEKAVARILSA
jgi:orotidine-5'-phosphate decarboxylase